jgi:malonate transporter and related proteins
MTQTFTIIAPLFLIILGAAAAQRLTHMGDDWGKSLNDYVLHFGLPILIFGILAKTEFSLTQQGPLIIFNSLFMLLGYMTAIITAKILKLSKQATLTLFICFTFGNTAYLGLPILESVSGDQILPSVSLIIAIHIFWVFSIGIGYLEYAEEKSKRNVAKKVITNLLLNPLLLGVLLGLIVGSYNISLPIILTKAIETISASVTPIVLVVIGLFIGLTKHSEPKDWIPAIAFTILTLIILPAAFYWGVQLFNYPPQDFFASVIEAATPLAITTFALADEYKLNKSFIAKSIVLSTVCSAITIPLWISIF